VLTILYDVKTLFTWRYIMTETPTRRGRPRGVESQHVMVRMPVDLIAQIDAYAASLQAQIGIIDINISRGMAIRELVKRGLQSVQAGPPTPQPAIPLAMEPASKATLSPMEPRADTPLASETDVVPSKVTQPLVTHETLTPSEEADQEPTSQAPEPPSHLATVAEPEPMAAPMAVPQAPEPDHPASMAVVERATETPPHRSQRGLPREKLQEIAEIAAEYDKLNGPQLSQLLFDRGIYRSIDRKTGEEKPVHRGTLKAWLDQAQKEGML
jgi:hypothetical protein